MTEDVISFWWSYWIWSQMIRNRRRIWGEIWVGPWAWSGILIHRVHGSIRLLARTKTNSANHGLTKVQFNGAHHTHECCNRGRSLQSITMFWWNMRVGQKWDVGGDKDSLGVWDSYEINFPFIFGRKIFPS